MQPKDSKTQQGTQLFLQKLQSDPVNMLEACGWGYWEKQAEITRACFKYNRVAVKACHGPGKSYVSARILLTFLHYYNLLGQQAVGLTTAPTFRQVEKVLWREVHRAIRQSKINLGGKLLKTEYHLSEDVFGFGFSPDNPDAAQGQHAENIIIIGDEASGIDADIYDALEGMLTSMNSVLLLIGNPTRAEGKFFEAFSSPLFHKISIGAFDTPNFIVNGIKTPQQLKAMTEDEVKALPIIAPYLVTPLWVWTRIVEWGIDTIPFQSRVMAQFPLEGDDVLIPYSYCEKSLNLEPYKVLKNERKSLGIDVARFGSDTTVFTVVTDNQILEIDWHQGKNLMKTVAKAKKLFKDYGMNLNRDTIVIDDTGLGGGATDRLVELEFPVLPVNFGAKKLVEHNYPELKPKNDKAVVFWNLSKKIKDHGFKIIDKGKLLPQLPTIRYSIKSNDEFYILSKEEMKKLKLKSPDYADSLALACWGIRDSAILSINDELRGPSIMGSMITIGH